MKNQLIAIIAVLIVVWLGLEEYRPDGKKYVSNFIFGTKSPTLSEGKTSNKTEAKTNKNSGASFGVKRVLEWNN